jgi:hypothetical protein
VSLSPEIALVFRRDARSGCAFVENEVAFPFVFAIAPWRNDDDSRVAQPFDQGGFVVKRVGERMVAGRMAIPFFQLAQLGRLPSLPKDYNGSRSTRWREQQGLGYQSVQHINDNEVATIYRNEYWGPIGCDRIRPTLDLVAFDTCVNMGRNRAIKILQQAVGVAPDGSFGPATQQACDSCDPANAVAQYCSIREALYRRFAEAPDQAIFLKGWLNRLNDLRVEAGVTHRRGPHGPADFGGAPYIEAIPDLAPGEPLEDWR